MKREQRDEQLSAYLDNDLGAEERARLEAQLAADSGLRVELEALRRTVVLVRDMPPVHLPRNFILPRTAETHLQPAQAARPRLAWVAPLLTAATAVVSLLFVVVLAGDLLFLGDGRMAFVPASETQFMEAPQVAMEPSPVSEAIEAEKAMPVATEPVAAAEVAQEAAPADVEGAVGRATTPLESTVSPEMDVEVAPLAEAEAPPEEALPSAEAPAMAGAGEMATATLDDGLDVREEAPASEPAPTMDAEETDAEPLDTLAAATEALPIATEEHTGGAEPTPGEVAEGPSQATEDAGAEAAAEEEERHTALEVEVVESPALSWQALEVALGLTALVLALATIWVWRARRR